MNFCRIIEISEKSGLHSLTGESSPFDSAVSLCRTLSLDSRLPGVRLVIRTTCGAPVTLYAFADGDPVTEELLRQLTIQLEWIDCRARYVGYEEAERLSETLAAKLTDRYGINELRNFRFKPIPRGGHIVMAMLSYCLGLPQSSLITQEDNNDTPLIYVDDCILSGLRAGEYVTKESGPVILATLFAPEEVCRMSRSMESPFECISAVEMEDLAPLLYKDYYGEWKRKWENTPRHSLMWIGQTQYLAFGWNEPESSFFNGYTNKIEPGFQVVPSHRCLNRRSREESERDRWELDEDGPGPLKAPYHVAVLELDGEKLVVGDFSKDRDQGNSDCLLLEGSSAEMWKALIDAGDVDGAAEELVRMYDADSETLRNDLSSFSKELMDRGLLIRE